MKTIFVDAWNTFITEDGVDEKLHTILEKFPNKKIILTNANDEQIIKLGMTDLPYELFTLKHNPDKPDPEYFKTMLQHFGLKPEDCVYFEHNAEAVKSAESVGIKAYNFSHTERDLVKLKDFLDKNLTTPS